MRLTGLRVCIDLSTASLDAELRTFFSACPAPVSQPDLNCGIGAVLYDRCAPCIVTEKGRKKTQRVNVPCDVHLVSLPKNVVPLSTTTLQKIGIKPIFYEGWDSQKHLI